MNLLENRVIIVTGAGAGVGRAIALQAAQCGAKVVVNDIGVNIDGSGGSADPARKTVADIAAVGGAAVVSIESVATGGGARMIVAQAMDQFGRLDAVVNCAGNLRDGLFHKMTEDDFDAVIAVHLKGSFNVSRAAAEHFRKQSSGAYVHMVSSSGLIGNLGQANYASAKMGIVGLSRSIAIDMNRYNVRSNCVAPAAFTRMLDTIPSQTSEAIARRKVNMQLDAAKIAPFTLSLLTDAAAGVTGQIFGVRGNEIFVYSQPRPIRSAYSGEGWTIEACLDRVLPMFQPALCPLEKAGDVFTWDPV
jgi:NAD(P)-dependent dehydrogenase (short-subunit alcohol dehydrogenase family)